MDRKTMVKRIIEKTGDSKNNLMVFAVWTDDEVEFAYNKLTSSNEQDYSKWCECNKDYGVDFYDDYEHPALQKHHYRCKRCKGIVQIG